MEIPKSIVTGVEVEFLVAQHRTIESRKNTPESRWACDPPLDEEETHGFPEYLERRAPCWAENCVLQKSCDILAMAGLPSACPSLREHKNNHPGHTFSMPNKVLTIDDGREIRAWNSNLIKPMAETDYPQLTDFYYMTRELHITRDVRANPQTSPSTEYIWYGTELNTPIIADCDEISNGLPTLKKALTSLQKNMIIGLNAGCGLHIHVSDGGRLSLQTAQRVVCLVLVLEASLLMPFSHPYRQKESPYCVPVTAESRAARNADENMDTILENDGPLQLVNLIDLYKKLIDDEKHHVDGLHRNMVSAMHRIYQQRSLKDLEELLRKFDSGVVRTSTRCALAISRHLSVEFRYPAATFDVDYIGLWVHLSRHVFGLALAATDVEFSEVLCGVFEVVTRRPRAGWEAVVKAIGLDWIERERWAKYIDQFEKCAKDLNKQGIMPAR